MTHVCPYTVTVGAYVLKALCARESLEFRRHAEVCPDCQREITELTPIVRLLEPLRFLRDRGGPQRDDVEWQTDRPVESLAFSILSVSVTCVTRRTVWAATVSGSVLVLVSALSGSSQAPGKIVVPPREGAPPAIASTQDTATFDPVASMTIQPQTATASGTFTTSRPATPSLTTTTTAGPPTIVCPDPNGAVGPVPTPARAEVTAELADLDTQIADANRRLRAQENPGDPNFVRNAILGPLTSRRVAALDRIAIAIGRYGPKPIGLERFAPCTVAVASPTG